jgi:hypothetical protein
LSVLGRPFGSQRILELVRACAGEKMKTTRAFSIFSRPFGQLVSSRFCSIERVSSVWNTGSTRRTLIRFLPDLEISRPLSVLNSGKNLCNYSGPEGPCRLVRASIQPQRVGEQSSRHSIPGGQGRPPYQIRPSIHCRTRRGAELIKRGEEDSERLCYEAEWLERE